MAAGPWAAGILSGGKIASPILLYWSVAILGVLAAVQTVTLPLLGGSRTAPKVAVLVFRLIIPNEALSYVLSRTVGAAGPILASICASLTLFRSVPLLIETRCTMYNRRTYWCSGTRAWKSMSPLAHQSPDVGRGDMSDGAR